MALLDHEFTADELRKYNPKYLYNAFSNSDIAEVKNFIQFSRGLVIKDNEVAEAFENETTLKASSIYMSAMDKVILGTSTPYEDQSIVKTYKEQNPYYLGLQAHFGIDPYTARKTKDYHIIKATFPTLDIHSRQLFEESYYESLDYYLKVTYTEAFSNQGYKREVMNLVLIFMTFNRYINKTMEGYFNVDTYDFDKLKNAFISNGVDLFDGFPINYQRRILKELNDLIRNKGTNAIFDIITNIFSFSGLKINKYELVKNIDDLGKSDVKFYRTESSKKLNTHEDPIIPFKQLTDKDPYWRSDIIDTGIIMGKVNNTHSKYISADIVVDLLKSSKQLSYFMSLLNMIHRTNENSILEYMKENNVDRSQATIHARIEDIDFSFSNKNISDKPINVFDSIVALYVLILNKLKWTDTIHRVNKVKNIYSYNFDSDVHDLLLSARKHLYQNKYNYSEAQYKRLMEYSSAFNVKSFKLPINSDFNYIMELYTSDYKYSSQTKVVSEQVEKLIKSTKMIDHFKNDNLYDSLEYLANTLLDKNRNLPYSFLDPYKEFQEIFGQFVELEVNTGYLKVDDIYTNFIKSKDLMTEFDTYIKEINSQDLNSGYVIFLKDKSIDNLKMVLNLLDKAIEQLYNTDGYTDKKVLKAYPNLSVYLNCFLSYRTVLNKVIFNLEDFSQVYLHNEDTRNELEKYILELDKPELVNIYKKLWNEKFIGDFDMELFKGFNSFSDYLKDKDPSLYYYTKIDVTPQNSGTIDLNEIYKDKIFELVNSIDNQMYLGGDYDFWMQNNFIGLTGYIKQYAYILIKAFKAYTVDTVYTSDGYIFDDKFDNSIHLTDEIIINSIGRLTFQDFIDIQDTNSFKTKYGDISNESIKLTDEVNLKVNEPTT